MSYYTTEFVTMNADQKICEELKKTLDPELERFDDYESSIENGEYYGRVYGNHVNLEDKIKQFTKDNKNVLVVHEVMDYESGSEFPQSRTYYKNGRVKYITPVWPEIDFDKELPDEN